MIKVTLLRLLLLLISLLYVNSISAATLKGVFADIELSDTDGVTTVFLVNKEAFPLDCRLGINGFQWKVEIPSNNKSEIFYYDPKKYTYDMVRFRCLKSNKKNLSATLRFRL